MLKTRKEPSANYSSIFLNGKTIRIPLDKDKPITELRFPEFYDVGINGSHKHGMCRTGKCTYCYTSANKSGYYTKNVSEKIKAFFSPLSQSKRPYQIALGGNGEPIEHPEFLDVLSVFNELDILPNLTSNGVLINEKNTYIVEAMKKYCGGVAITCHNHLEKHWRRALDILHEAKIKVNVHLIISTKESIDKFKKLYQEYNGVIDYFVLLPYMPVGFAKNLPSPIDFNYLESFLDSIHHYSNLAFGSNFYHWLKKINKWGISLYPPEIMSKYIVFEQEETLLFNNSFEAKSVQWDNGVVLT